jgi:hydrogenase/urease accessory protein HupE
VNLRRLLLLLVLGVCARPASAHPAPYSYVDLRLDEGRVHGSIVVHAFDIAHELGIQPPERLLDAGAARTGGAALARLLASRIALRLDGHPVALEWTRTDLAADRQGWRLAFDASTAMAGRLDLEARLFPYDPQHQTFVNVYEAARLEHQAVLDARHPSMEYYAGSPGGVTAVARTFVPSGIHHILIGPDHVLFIVALVILGGSLARLLAIVTAFTVGHSVTLSLAALGVVSPPVSIVEPAIALSIVVVGVDNLLVRRARDARDARDLRPWAALSFGLVHGFGFASVLQQIGLPPTALGWSLFSFNLGVELGQIAVVVLITAVIGAIRAYSTVLAERVAFAGSVVVIAAGAWWFAERVLA